MNHRVIVFILILTSHSLIAQVSNLGVPFIINYPRSEYNAGSQTWDVLQGDNGMMYFANNDGLLEFDGVDWNVYSLPNRSIVRAIEKGPDNIIYAGGYNELGYYKVGTNGGGEYFSFMDMLPESMRDFGDVWKILVHADGVIYQTYYQLFIFKKNEVVIIEAPHLFHFSFLVENEYYIVDIQEGIMRYAMGNLFPLKGTEILTGTEIWGILPYKNKLLIATASEGLFLYDGNTTQPLKSETNDFLKNNQVYCTFLLPDNRFAFGTIQNGIVITDRLLKIEQVINKNDGMQNNTVLCIGTDDLKNLWLGTDHGIDYLELNLPISSISSKYNLSTGYAMIIDDGRLYFGTNQGLFTMNSSEVGCVDEQHIDLISETKGQVWTLQKLDNQIFCGHNNGTFIIEGNMAKKISGIGGGWVYKRIPGNDNLIIGGTYTGLTMFEKDGGEWIFRKAFEGFNQSSRKMEFDKDGSLWITHGYNGIYHVFFDSRYDSITSVDFYSSLEGQVPQFIYGLTYLNKELVFITNEGILEYSESNNTFIESENAGKLFNGIDAVSVLQDSVGNIWYFDNENAGVLRLSEDGSYLNIQKPFRKLQGEFVSAFELVYPYNDENVFFGTEKGFAKYNPRFAKDYSYEFNTYIISMRTQNPDSVIHFSHLENQDCVLDFSNNEVEFLFSANDFENTDQIIYSTFLEGNDKEWSGWENRNIRTYTNLREGKYVFRVKAKNIYGTVSMAKEVSFSVLPPWYRSIFAYILYAALFLIFLISIMLMMRRRFVKARLKSEEQQKEQFRKREEKLQRESLEAEKEIIRMRNEKLREGIKMKDKELANSTMQMLQKNEMLITLREELKTLADIINSDTHRHDIIRLVRGINREIDNENQWKLFETHFESVHEEFLKRIKLKYPELTPRELKLCAYLRMNISSKEISVLMNISTRGVEISRYRLRKKLGLARETNLTDFILSF